MLYRNNTYFYLYITDLIKETEVDGCYGQHGWKQFHRNRKDILVELDRVYELLADRPIKTAHGDSVEAYLRKWLGEFLPKKYGVTSGYIIPDFYDNNPKMYHYDIIIYDSLEAPILWTESNYDNSHQGKFLAIPARHVFAVYEVKSRFTKKTISDAVEKLKEVNSFKAQLNDNYHSGLIFVDLKESEIHKNNLLEDLYKGTDAHGFIGGMILRYEGDESSTGLISVHSTDSDDSNDENASSLPLVKKIDDLNIYLTEGGDLKLAEGGCGAILVSSGEKWLVSKSYNCSYVKNKLMLVLTWSRSNFSEFSIRLINLLGGTYDPDKQISFGRVFDHINLKEATLQSKIFHPKKPFVRLSVRKLSNKDVPMVEYRDDGVFINFLVIIENAGNVTVSFSLDGFQTVYVINPNELAKQEFCCRVDVNKESDMNAIKENIAANQQVIPFRVVYFQGEKGDDFVQVKKNIIIRGKTIEAVDVT